MTLSPPPRAEVYLVENRLNPISTRAALELTDDNLRSTVKEYSKWVEKALGISDGFWLPDEGLLVWTRDCNSGLIRA
jgi:hypothetical protein